jgi:acetolactate synthase I/II/III large subunit
LGMHGNYGPNIKTNECDVLIAVGMRFDDRVTGDLSKYARQAKVIHIEIDPAEIDKNVKTTVAIVSDAKEALIALTEAVEAKSYPEWLQEFADADRTEYEKVISKDFAPSTEKIKMAEVIKMLSDKTEGTAIVATDVGQHQMTTTRYYQFTEKDSNITSGGAGTMGFCLPAAIGAKVGRPDRQVVAIIGDGGFQMTMQELGVIMQYKIAVKVIILNNNFLGMVRQWQQLFFDNRYSSVDMHNPNFIKLAEAFDIKAQKVEKREDLDGALQAMLDSSEAYFLEICVEKETNVFPMVPAGAGVGDIRLE